MQTQTTTSKEYFDMLANVRKSYIQKWTGKEGQDPYKFTDWFEWMTPIERNVWSQIRYLGLPMYPQFPVGRYYLDFADPFRKIGIEVDGRIHEEDEVAAKDKQKDQYLRSKGWKVLRIPGWSTYKCRDDYTDFENDETYGQVHEKYWQNCSEGWLQKLKDKIYRPLWESRNAESKCIFGDSLISSHEVLQVIQEQEDRMPTQRVKNRELFKWE